MNNDGMELHDSILIEIRSYYLGRPASRDRVFEVLNALAAATATVIKGTGNDQAARDFFGAALDRNVKGSCDA